MSARTPQPQAQAQPTSAKPARKSEPLPAAPVKLFSQIGQSGKDVLYGSKSDGLFQYDHKLSWATKTSTGVTFITSSTRRGNALSSSLTGSYTGPRLGGDFVIDSAGVLELDVMAINIAPCTKLTATCTIPGAKPKVTIDINTANMNSRTTLTGELRPLITSSMAAGVGQLAIGYETAYDTSSQKLTRWAVGMGWHDSQRQIGAFLTDSGATAKVLAGMKVTDRATAGVEVAKSLVNKEALPAISGGVALRGLGQAKTATVKARLDNMGQLSVLYRDTLTAGPIVTLTAKVDTTDLNKTPQFGVSLDI